MIKINISRLCLGLLLLLGSVQSIPCAEPLAYEPVAAPGAPHVNAVFLPGEEPALYVRFDAAALPKAFHLSAQLYDFWGVAAGTVAVEPQENPGLYAVRPSARQLGWYRVQFVASAGNVPVALKRKPANGKTSETYDFIFYAMVPSPHSPEQVSDSPFGIMTALNSEHMPIPLQIELAARSGCRWVREILSWRQIHPERDRIDLQPVKDRYESLTAHGLKIESMLTTTPPWMRPHSQDKFAFPQDLLAAYGSARQIVAGLSPKIAAYEIWNEPDIAHFACETPDRYAAVVKAVSLAIEAAGRGPEILGGVFARDPRVGSYSSVLAENGIGAYLDGYSFHTYQPVVTGAYSKVLRIHGEVAARLGMEGKPLWLTETALPYSRNKIPDPLPAMSAQVQQMVESYMLSLSTGVKPVFWFVIRPYFGKNFTQFGLVDSRLCPLPAYPAFAVMTHELGIGKFLGSFDHAGSSIYLFDSGAGDVAVVIGPNNRNRLDLPPLAKEAQAVNVMGQPVVLQASEAGVSVVSGGFAVYIRQPQWRQRITSAVAKKTVPPPDPKLRREIVVQALYPDRFVDNAPGAVRENWDGISTNWAPRGYLCKKGETVPVTLEVHNFGTEPRQVSLAASLPEGCRAEPPGGRVTVEPMACEKITLSIRTDGAEAKPAFWKFTGTAADGVISPAASLWMVNP